MKITILGAGAMGCMVASAFSSENEINLVDPYEAHMNEVSENGIKIKDNNNQETIVKVSSAKTSSKDLDIQDLVIILVKGYDTEKILMENMNIIGDNTVVMTLQNGIGNVDIIKKHVKDENIAQGILYISAAIEKPGVISANIDWDKTNIIFGPVSKNHDKEVFENIEKAINSNSIISEINPDVDKIMWRKLYVNAIYNLPCAIMHLSTKYTTKNQNAIAILKQISDEFIMVTDKLGYNFDGEKLFDQYVLHKEGIYNDIMPSAAQDTKKQRKTEAEFLNGAVVRKAKELGLEVPVNETIYRLACVEMENYDNRF